MNKLKTWQKVIISLVLGFGCTAGVAALLVWLETQPPFVVISIIGGICTSAIILLYLTREEHVYLCYHVGDTPNDVRVKAVCTTWLSRESIMEEGDCYREIAINKEIPEARWEDLQYKTKYGYMTVG